MGLSGRKRRGKEGGGEGKGGGISLPVSLSLERHYLDIGDAKGQAMGKLGD